MSDQSKIGELIQGHAGRDAIHIAIAPVVANGELFPNQDIGLVGGSLELVDIVDQPIGKVDPFLKSPVRKGERFYMFLYPNTITGLRHVWQHPAFTAAAEAVRSKLR